MHQVGKGVDRFIRVLDAAEGGKEFISALLGHGDLAVEKSLCIGIVHHDGDVIDRQLDVDLGALEVVFCRGNDRGDRVFGIFSVILKALVRDQRAAAEIRALGEGGEEGIRARKICGYDAVDTASGGFAEMTVGDGVNKSLLERMDRVGGGNFGVKNDRGCAV